MLWVKIGTHIGDHERFLAAGPVARDLYFWGLTYAGKHETDGMVPMVAVLACPWGAGGTANIKVASKLVEIGLWSRTDAGFLILRWSEQGNQTKGSLAAKREEGRKRKERWEERKRNGVTNGVTNTVPNGVRNASGSTSTSKSLSGSGSGSQIASAPDAMPEWFAGACDAAAMAVGGEVGERPARWAEYIASRERKGWSANHGDAVGWLSTVVRSERAKASGRPAARGAEITKQPYDPEAPWMKLPEVG